MDVLAFQRKWIDASRQKERSAYVTHFTDLCELLGVDKPLDADPAGETYGFEKGSRIAGGGDGWADVWFKNHFAWEYKGRGKDLDAAYVQLLRYKDDLGNPPLLVVSDLNLIRIHTNFTNTVKKTIEVDLATLADDGVLPMLRRMWIDPASFRPRETPDTVTIAAAERFSRIAAGLHARGEDPERGAHFLVQVVFCLFAEDIGLLPDRIFSRMVEADRDDPATFQADARELLDAMHAGGRVSYRRIPHVNGGLFATVDVPELTAAEIGMIHEAAKLDWSQIEPAILGTLFERSLDPAKRSQLGAHYTSRADIERVVEPVVIAPLKRRWADLRAKYEPGPDQPNDRHAERAPEARRRSIPVRSTSKPSRSDTKRRTAMLRDIDAFLSELRSVTVLDPACGSGNFLYVALSELLALEKEVMTWRATAATLPLGLPELTPARLKGIEINPYARELAQAAIWIGYLQWMNANGFGWSEPVLAPLDSIEHKDALLAFGEDGTVTEATWPPATCIIGNPPFLGGKRLRAELGDDYVDTLFSVYEGKVARESDLCVYFFEQAREEIEDRRSERAGLLATQAIRFGANRRVLEAIKKTGDIFFAWSDEPWILDGAAVRISIVGFDDGSEQERTLDGEPTDSVNADLTSTQDLSSASRLEENAGMCFQGPVKVGAFDLDPTVSEPMINAVGNPNGRPNSDVIKPWVNASDIVRRARGMYIIDFGKLEKQEAALYEQPFEYVVANVKPDRINNRDRQRRTYWWRLGRSGDDLKDAVRPLARYIVTPRVSRHRLFAWVPPTTLPDSRVFAFAREDDYFFGVLHSRAHEVWSLRMASRHGVGNDPTYNNSTCFETFPMPWPPGQEPVDDPRVIAIADAAKRLNELRENWLNPPDATEAELKKRTLTTLYNARPTWLANAHAALDRAVWATYGWPADEVPAEVAEDVILSRLLALNQERATNES
jgi:type II restriction/modification system DNA methylase subunit YeeA